MKDLTKVFIDISKLSEEQIKSLVPILEKAGYHVYFEDRMFLKHGKYDKPYFHLFNNKSWMSSSILVMKQELTYPEFIRLFDGGEGERTELLPDVAYWRHRCLLAEKCLSVSPCDPDITEEQIKAHKDYNQYLETFGKKY